MNATSVFLGTKLAAAEMAKTGGGSIVNISSIMGIVASEESHPGYPASKARCATTPRRRRAVMDRRACG